MAIEPENPRNLPGGEGTRTFFPFQGQHYRTTVQYPLSNVAGQHSAKALYQLMIRIKRRIQRVQNENSWGALF